MSSSRKTPTNSASKVPLARPPTANAATTTKSNYFSAGNPSTFCKTDQFRSAAPTSRVDSVVLSCVDLIPIEEIQSGRTFFEPAKIYSGGKPQKGQIYFDTKHIVHEVPLWGNNAKHERNDSFHDPNPWRRHGCIEKLHEIGGWVSLGDRHVRKADREYVFVSPGSRPPISPDTPLFNHVEQGTIAALNAYHGMPAVIGSAESTSQFEKGNATTYLSLVENSTTRNFMTREPKSYLRSVQAPSQMPPKQSQKPKILLKSKKTSGSNSGRSKSKKSSRKSLPGATRFASLLSHSGKESQNTSSRESSIEEPLSDYADTLFGIPSIRQPSEQRIQSFAVLQPPKGKSRTTINMDKLSCSTASVEPDSSMFTTRYETLPEASGIGTLKGGSNNSCTPNRS
ncbi:hypothetical protein L596_023938 [Steinernema carpocapsae]|uniref:Uncharacterized protein n=1 Tax=Steinernema carpocapsae TaxID=34508 RepID=A0A4U5MF88_STECR|nr:hypothetical protein L596_023938 [Steinernema carpocapsae]